MIRISVPGKGTTQQVLGIVENVRRATDETLVVDLPEAPSEPNGLILEDVIKGLEDRGMPFRVDDHSLVITT